MSRIFLGIAILSLAATGCDDNNTQQVASYQAPIHSKPVISIVPVIDSTKNDYEWSLSEEFSSILSDRLSQHKHLSVADLGKVHEKTKKLNEKHNPFSPDVSWVKNAFQGDEFVVFLELIEHEEVFRQDHKKPASPEECSADLNMTMRVRVFDVRGNEPKVILQELVQNSHFIPRQFTSEHFYQASWGTENFQITPVGLAHAKFTKELASRIGEYVLLAR